ncbi:MAG: GNAT family N-acetyltransferase [Bacteroidota bacterium]
MIIRDITVSDFNEVLEINERSVNYLSPLELERLEELLGQSKYSKVIEQDKQIAAFIIAFDQSSKYSSPNFLWFKERYKSFLYIDRIVVHENYRRMGLADNLYSDIFRFAKNMNYECITCEIDSRPPNVGSMKFHDKYEFIEVGTQWLYNGEKQVSLRERKLQ